MGLRDTLGEIDETYGKGAVAQGSRGRTFQQHRFQAMMFDFDLALGGGPTWGDIIQIYGPPSGGKSVDMLKMIAGAQQVCRYCRELFLIDANGESSCECDAVCSSCEVAYTFTAYEGPVAEPDDPYDWEVLHDEWICECLVNSPGSRAKRDRIPKVTRRAARCRGALFDAENSFDVAWATAMGVDPDLLFVFVPEYAEQGLDIFDKLMRSEEIDIAAIDSIADLVPSKEIASSTEEWQMGLQARLVNKGIRRMRASLNALGADALMRPTIVLINQTRDNIGGYEEVCPGGWAQKFAAGIRVRVNTASYKFKESGSGKEKTKELQYADMSGFTKKNKRYPPMKKYSVRLYLDDQGEDAPAGSTNEHSVVFDRAKEFGVITQPKKNGPHELNLAVTKRCKPIYADDELAEDDRLEFVRSWKTQKEGKQELQRDHLLFWAVRNVTMAQALETVR